MSQKLRKKQTKYKKIGNNYLFENGAGVNETSLNVYLLCDKNTRDEIFDIFKKEYDLQEENMEEVKQDVLNCLNELLEADLIEIVEE